jgi:sulfite reductase (NADPH) flavoprotein alpha-component
VHVDPYTAAVVLAESSRTTAAGTRIINTNRAIHTGDIFGIPSKILMSLASLAAVAQVITGLTMWWKRA